MTSNVMLGWLIFGFGVAVGVSAVRAWRDARYMIAKEEFEGTVIEQGKEIARLRAQVALHIGKEE
jgi:hypothetical protein